MFSFLRKDASRIDDLICKLAHIEGRLDAYGVAIRSVLSRMESSERDAFNEKVFEMIPSGHPSWLIVSPASERAGWETERRASIYRAALTGVLRSLTEPDDPPQSN